jgi:NADH-quinone oxidoreductase subunit J
MTLVTISLYVLGVLAVLGGIYMVIAKHPMQSAVALLFVMLILGAMYALLSAPVMAMLQIIIYAGAIMTLIIFIVSLVDVKGDDLHKTFSCYSFLAVPVVLSFFALVAIFVAVITGPEGQMASNFGASKILSTEIFTKYCLHFELASILLLVGVIGISTLRGKKDQNS